VRKVTSVALIRPASLSWPKVWLDSMYVDTTTSLSAAQRNTSRWAIRHSHSATQRTHPVRSRLANNQSKNGGT
jgi:hypothetical protein